MYINMTELFKHKCHGKFTSAQNIAKYNVEIKLLKIVT